MGGLVPSRLRENERASEKRKGERASERGQNGMPSVATRLDALANQISILAVASLLHAHYQKVICGAVFKSPVMSLFLPSYIISSLLLKIIVFMSRITKRTARGECGCVHARAR